jgi:hypothetical protein
MKVVRLALLLVCGGAISSHESKGAILTIDLGTAANFAVLAGAGINNAGFTSITGDVGSSPTATTAGFDTVTLNGTNHGGDSVTVSAKAALSDAYNDAVGRTPTTIYGAIYDLGGLTLTSGVYNNPSSFGLTGTLTLDAQGDPNAVWIFQMGSTFISGANSSVELVGGAQSSNVFWQVGSSATLGAGTSFAGTMLVATSISLGAGADVAGRALAMDGAVTLVDNTLVAVPEPSVWGAMGIALGALVLVRRFRPRAYAFQTKH